MTDVVVKLCLQYMTNVTVKFWFNLTDVCCYNFLLLFFQYMTDVAVLLGAERERASEELWLCIEFETELANVKQTFLFTLISVKKLFFRPRCPLKYSIHSLLQDWSCISWGSLKNKQKTILFTFKSVDGVSVWRI